MEPTTPAQEPKQELDPLIARLLEDTGKVLGDIKVDKPIELPNIQTSTLTLGERVQMNAQAAEEAKNNEPPKVEPPPAEPKQPEPPKPAEPEPKKVTVKKTQPQVQPAPVVQPPTPPVQPQPPTQPPAPVDPDADFIASLNDDEREEYNLALYAGKVNPALKNKASETLTYFKKLAEFTKTNQDAEPDSEEFQNFIATNKPKWSNAERRRIERTLIEEQAAARAEAKLNAKLVEVQKRQHILEETPKVQQRGEQFRETLTNGELPDTFSPVVKEAATKLNAEGFDAARKEYPVEAPILADAMEDANEFIRLSHGVAEYNQANPRHAKLTEFVKQQGEYFAQQPANVTVRNGRAFLPLHQYAALNATNPNAVAQYWTFDDGDILNMIRMDAAKKVTEKVAELEAAGFVRQKKQAKVESPTPPPPPHESPKSGASSAPGAAVVTQPVNPNADLFEALVPGYKPKF